VSGVGHQRHGIGEHAVDELHGNESEVQADADGEGPAEAGSTVHTSSPVMGMVIAFMRVIVTVRAMCAHCGNENQRLVS
jgi:hypothetical protein